MSISLTLSVFLIPYGIVILFFAVFAAINIHHLIRYAATTKVSFVVTFVFLAGSVFLLFFSWSTLHKIDWQQEIGVKTPFSQGQEIDF